MSEFKVTVADAPTKLGAAEIVSISFREERDDDITDISSSFLNNKVLREPPFRGEIQLPPEWIVPLWRALTDYVQERYKDA